jgi:hypothetical protein
MFRFSIPLRLTTEPSPAGLHNLNGTINFVLDTLKGQRTIPLHYVATIGRERFRLSPRRVFMLISRAEPPKSTLVKLEFLENSAPPELTARISPELPVQCQLRRDSPTTYSVTLALDGPKLTTMPTGACDGTVTLSGPAIADVQLPVSLFVRD